MYNARLKLGPVQKPLNPSNPLLLGAGVQPVSGLDGQYNADGTPNETARDRTRLARPTIIRMGGTSMDTYDWRAGVGSERGYIANYLIAGDQQIAYAGTDELLDLCADVYAIPLLTISPYLPLTSSLEWIQYALDRYRGARRIRGPLIVVGGNEPYLDANAWNSDYDMTSEEFAAWAVGFVSAVRAAYSEDDVRIGIPTRSDFIGGLPAVHKIGHQDALFAAFHAADWVPDFFAIHNAYLPDISGPGVPGDVAWVASQVSHLTFDADMQQMRDKISEFYPGLSAVEFGATEYAGFAQGIPGFSATAAAACYEASVLMEMVRQRVELATRWSLSGNGDFGVVQRWGTKRLGQYVFEVCREWMSDSPGTYVTSAAMLTCPTLELDAPCYRAPAGAPVTRVGHMEMLTDAAGGGTSRTLMVNRDATAPCALSFRSAAQMRRARLRTARANGGALDPNATPVLEHSLPTLADPREGSCVLPPASVSLLTLEY